MRPCAAASTARILPPQIVRPGTPPNRDRRCDRRCRAAQTACAPTSRTRTTPARTAPPARRGSTSSTKRSRSGVERGRCGIDRDAAGARRRAAARRSGTRRRARDLDLLGRHLLADVLEQRRRQITLARVGQHAHDVAARGRARRAICERGRERRAARGADEDAFAARELARQPQRVGAGHGHDLVDEPGAHGVLGELRDEIRRPALHQVRTELRVAPVGVPSASRGCGMPLPSTGELSGSAADDLACAGLACLSARATPLSVPPVPKPVTQ